MSASSFSNNGVLKFVYTVEITQYVACCNNGVCKLSGDYI